MIAELGSSGVLIFSAVFIAAAVIMWLIYDILNQPHLRPGMKVLWIVLAFFFSILTLIVYVPFVRRKDRSG